MATRGPPGKVVRKRCLGAAARKVASTCMRAPACGCPRRGDKGRPRKRAVNFCPLCPTEAALGLGLFMLKASLSNTSCGKLAKAAARTWS